jgi:large subunit ribosomal protein L29
MKIKEIREKETSAIVAEMKDMQKHLFDLRTQAVTEKLEDPSQLLKARKDIARMKTVLREREPAERKQAAEQSQPQGTIATSGGSRAGMPALP